MNVDLSSHTQWSRLSRLIGDTMGLHFPQERWADLQRGLSGAAEEWGFTDMESCADWLLSAPPTKAQLQVLAGHLTIGETYFFREKKTFDVLANDLLPSLINARRAGGSRRLRIWSAACCTGEEAYSLAIMIHRLLPDLVDWRVTILATDINARALRKAVAGAYGEWSFRDETEDYRKRYFTRNEAGLYVVVPAIRNMVTFAHLNLVEDVYPSLATDTNAMDLIFCRNVLMYFAPAQAGRVIAKLHHSLLDGGWLAVSPCEASQALFPQFLIRNSPGVILYRKDDATVRAGRLRSATSGGEAREFFVPSPAWIAPVESVLPPPELEQSLPRQTEVLPVLKKTDSVPETAAEALYAQGHYAEAAEMLLASFDGRVRGARAFSLLARAFANQGRLDDALAWCDRWIAADKLDHAGHYLRGVILLEHGDPVQARGSLQRAVYLAPDFVLAHFALGNLARGRGLSGEADKHFDNALRLLASHRQDDLLPESDSLTAGRLTETIAALSTLKNAS